ncbi:MAG: hypothetical protein ACYDBV_15390 [Nitrospiria bacterium]
MINELDSLNLDKLRNEDRFGEFILVAWGSLETFVNLAVLRLFANPDDSDLQDFLVSQSFPRKLGLLKDKGVVTKEQCGLINKFRDHRNRLFHRVGLEFVRIFDSQIERETLMDESTAAYNIAVSL